MSDEPRIDADLRSALWERLGEKEGEYVYLMAFVVAASKRGVRENRQPWDEVAANHADVRAELAEILELSDDELRALADRARDFVRGMAKPWRVRGN